MYVQGRRPWFHRLAFGLLALLLSVGSLLTLDAPAARAASLYQYVDGLWCYYQDDNIGKDDVYFLIFEGIRNTDGSAGASTVHVLRPSIWEGFYKDRVEYTDVSVPGVPLGSFSFKKFYVAALIEEDDSGDFAAGTSAHAKLTLYMQTRFAEVVRPGVSLDYARSQLANAMNAAINLYDSNDDQMGRAAALQFPNFTNGKWWTHVKFSDRALGIGTGDYAATFTVISA